MSYPNRYGEFVPEGVPVPSVDPTAVQEVSFQELGEDGNPSSFFSIFKRRGRKDGLVLTDWTVADNYGPNVTLQVVINEGAIEDDSIVVVREAKYGKKGLIVAGAVLGVLAVAAGTIRMTNRSSTGS